MKKVLFLYIVLLTLGCKSIKSHDFPFDPCNFIQSILDQKDINRISGLNNAKDVLPSIRIFDLSGTFSKCQSLYQSDKFGFSIPYHIEEKLKPSINTGIYRDIIIHKFSFDSNKNKGDIILSVATFETHNNVNTNFRIVLKFKILNGGFIELTNAIITDYIDKFIDFDYEKQY